MARRTIRKQRTSPVEVTWEESLGHSRSQSAVTEDVSDTGMGIHVRTAIKAGSTVHIKTDSGVRLAIVRHCTGSGSDYFIGVEFQRWAGPAQKAS